MENYGGDPQMFARQLSQDCQDHISQIDVQQDYRRQRSPIQWQLPAHEQFPYNYGQQTQSNVGDDWQKFGRQSIQDGQNHISQIDVPQNAYGYGSTDPRAVHHRQKPLRIGGDAQLSGRQLSQDWRGHISQIDVHQTLYEDYHRPGRPTQWGLPAHEQFPYNYGQQTQSNVGDDWKKFERQSIQDGQNHISQIDVPQNAYGFGSTDPRAVHHRQTPLRIGGDAQLSGRQLSQDWRGHISQIDVHQTLYEDYHRPGRPTQWGLPAHEQFPYNYGQQTQSNVGDYWQKFERQSIRDGQNHISQIDVPQNAYGFGSTDPRAVHHRQTPLRIGGDAQLSERQLSQDWRDHISQIDVQKNLYEDYRQYYAHNGPSHERFSYNHEHQTQLNAGGDWQNLGTPSIQDCQNHISQIQKWSNLHNDNHSSCSTKTPNYQSSSDTSVTRVSEAISLSSEPVVNSVSYEPGVTSVSSGLKDDNDEEQNRLVNYLYYLYERPKMHEQNGQNTTIASKPTEDVEDVEHDPHDRSNDLSDATLIVKQKYKLGCDKSNMYMNTSDQSKKLCCPFCEKLVSKLARHLEAMHGQEPDVKNFLSFPKGSKKRRTIQDSLRKIGLINFSKNAALNNDQLIPSRQPNPKHKRTIADQTTCPYCLGPYAKSSIHFHIKHKCPQKPIEDERTEGERVVPILAAAAEARYHEHQSPALQAVFDKFHDDVIVRSIRFDWLVTVYGNKLTSKYTKPKNVNMIKSRLRLIGRVLNALKNIEPEVTELANLFIPKHYDRVVDAIRAVARVDTVRNEFIAPATASSAVTAIRQIAEILIVEYIKKDDQEKQRVTRDFLAVMNSDMHISINKMVTETQARMARQRIVTLPSSDDVRLLAQYIDAERRECFMDLSETFSIKEWKRLNELTMASIIVYNRRRVGDTQNILDEDFTRKEVIDDNTNQELLSTLPEQSKRIAKQFSRMKVRGKKNRTVPVLLKADVEDCLKLLISHRQDAGVSSVNNFLFALPSQIDNFKVVDAGRVLKKCSYACGAKNPSILTATNLRKHLATICVSLQLSDTSVADVADFMGHAEKVHREYYRQNTIDRQIVQMSQVLEAAQGNSTSKNHNQGVSNNGRKPSRKRKAPPADFDGKKKPRPTSKKIKYKQIC